MKWNVVATKEQVEKTIIALKSKNIEAEFVATGAEAKKRLFDILPEGAEVMSMTSVTLDTIGV
ncbi:LUD domain-containing protein, partial [Patescibacteria group bacterium]|nr:LUD domain-containing protein [Patescibacteria group bacterium]